MSWQLRAPPAGYLHDAVAVKVDDHDDDYDYEDGPTDRRA
jgi:hypothetical protein